MNDHVHPTFRAILNGIVAQPAQLVRAANKASPRRFTAEPITGFARHRAKDKADALTRANERNVEPLEEERIAARCRVDRLQLRILRIEAKLARLPLLWWLTKSGRYKADWHAGFDFAVEKLKTNKPEQVLSPTLALSPFESDAFHDGARAAVAEFEAAQSQRMGV